jgi:CheY-like chemotaxis protein
MSDRKKILLVDDDPDTLEALAIDLEGAGFEVLPAGGEEQAEEMLLRVQPDLAIVDLMMENMDSGFALSHRLKQLYPDTPVIILTSAVAKTRLDLTPVAGDGRPWIKADAWLDKPARPEQLRAQIARLIGE